MPVMATHLSRSEGRTPSHLMSGVVKLELSYDMFFEPLMYTERICAAKLGVTRAAGQCPIDAPAPHLEAVRIGVHEAKHGDAQVGLHLLQKQSAS